MIFYFFTKECYDEALVSTLIFLGSIFFIIVSYEAVNENGIKTSTGNIERM
jgi:hypothetical protein